MNSTGARLLDPSAQHRLRTFRRRRAFRFHARVRARHVHAMSMSMCMHAHSMCSVCGRMLHTPPFDDSCFDDGNPIRDRYPDFIGASPEGCPPFPPPTPTPPPSLPPVDQQRRLRYDGDDTQRDLPSSDARLMSNTSHGHYYGGKVHKHMHMHVRVPFVCAYAYAYTQTRLLVSGNMSET